VIGLLAQERDGMRFEEGGVHALAGRLPGDRLGAVLAEFRVLAVPGRRVAPRAGRAVEAVDLVDFEQRSGGPGRAHLGQRVPHGDGHAADADRGGLWFAGFQVPVFRPRVVHTLNDKRVPAFLISTCVSHYVQLTRQRPLNRPVTAG
jgi:hypothetical protein